MIEVGQRYLRINFTVPYIIDVIKVDKGNNTVIGLQHMQLNTAKQIWTKCAVSYLFLNDIKAFKYLKGQNKC